MEQVMEQVYADLRRIAHHRMHGKYGGNYRDLTLEPTALVHETFLRLREQRGDFRNRRHFFAIATRLMMRALIDYQRSRLAERRGGDQVRVTLSRFHGAANSSDPVDMAAFSEALDQLSEHDGRKADVVRLYALWGFEMAEIAEMLEVAVRTVERDWKFARLWLADRLEA
jgi:RNA polymerase sigma factor (TIGR02999 family)